MRWHSRERDGWHGVVGRPYACRSLARSSRWCSGWPCCAGCGGSADEGHGTAGRAGRSVREPVLRHGSRVGGSRAGRECGRGVRTRWPGRTEEVVERAARVPEDLGRAGPTRASRRRGHGRTRLSDAPGSAVREVRLRLQADRGRGVTVGERSRRADPRRAEGTAGRTICTRTGSAGTGTRLRRHT